MKLLLTTAAVAALSGCCAPHSDRDANHQHPASGDQHTRAANATGSMQIIPSAPPLSGIPVSLVMTPIRPDGRIISALEVIHEHPVHFIAVSSRLSWFVHLHPEPVGDGSYHQDLTFPSGGGYSLFAEFTPTGGGHTVTTVPMQVSGDEHPEPALTPDLDQAKHIGTYSVTTTLSSAQVGVAQLAFTIEHDGEPVFDLEPVLGERGHCVILSEDRSQFLHSHPSAGRGAGPTVTFYTEIPTPGLYKAWGQFRHQGHDLLVPVVFRVDAAIDGDHPTASPHTDHGH